MKPGAELLLCHATGTPRWDIPKGLVDDGESARDAALRETREETGVELDGRRLLDLGVFAYLRDKDLHLFAARGDAVDPKACACSTCFIDPHGRSRPEMDGYAWVAFDAVPRRVGKSLAVVLMQKLSLPTVWRDLIQHAPSPD